MKVHLLAGASALALSFAPGSVAALTAEAAWQSWVDAAEDAGTTITAGSETRDGAALTLTEIVFSIEIEDEVSIRGTMPQIVFTENGDGSVSAALPDSYPIVFSGEDSDGEDNEVTLLVSHPDMSLVMTDAAEGGIATEYSAPTVDVVVAEITTEDSPEDLEVAISMTDIAGRSVRTGGDVPQLENAVSVGSGNMVIGGTDPDTGGSFNFTASVADVVTSSSGTLTPLYGASEDLGVLLQNGFSTLGEASTGAIVFDISAAGMPENFTASGSIASTSGNGRIDAERLEYGVTYTGVDFTASGSEIPFPQVTAALGELATVLSMPSTPTDEAQPMNLTVALRDLALGEEIWSLFDPGGALPRDPATLVVDLAGQIRFLVDLFSEDAMESAEVPAEVPSLDINELLLSLAGATLSGEGAVALDYDTPGPFGPGSPAPDGQINLRLEGGQGLLAALVGMGLVPEEQAMMARMMTGMIARPGDGEDVLISEIEVQPDGTILANGAPLPF